MSRDTIAIAVNSREWLLLWLLVATIVVIMLVMRT
jgi:hypothetical protein